MKVKRRSASEIQGLRGILEVACRYGCGERVIITATTKGKTVVLEEQINGCFVINDRDQAVWVPGGGDYGFHCCPDLAEIL